jgi:hypothetical protein
MRALRAALFDVVVLDWDAEYDDLPLETHAPPFPLAAPPALLADALAEVERAEEGGHMVAAYLREALATDTPEKAIEHLRREAAIAPSYPLRGALAEAHAGLYSLRPDT